MTLTQYGRLAFALTTHDYPREQLQRVAAKLTARDIMEMEALIIGTGGFNIGASVLDRSFPIVSDMVSDNRRACLASTK